MIQHEELQQVAVQAAHDIRAPLAALAVVERDLSALPEETRRLLSLSIARIREISSELLDRARGTRSAAQPSSQCLAPWLDALVSEKRVQHGGKLGLEIALEVESPDLRARILPAELLRVLSNLIDNAVEACAEQGRVIVRLSGSEGRVHVRVIDNGMGMTGEVLSNLGQEGYTHGKSGGNGLGVAHARKTLEAWGGRLLYESAWGSGTTATVELRESYFGAQS